MSNVKKAKKKTVDDSRGFDINERYQKKTDLEHVLLRPDTYVGGIDKISRDDWVIEKDDVVALEKSENANDESNCGTENPAAVSVSIKKRHVTYCPALMKIFDEVLINSRDHSIRDETCNRIKVTFDQESGAISIENNGNGIPVEMHKEGCYLPELVFGHFKAGENFSDKDQKIVGGKNGYGATCANAFSTRFEVETVDKHNGLKYVQYWENNMSFHSEPEITKCTKVPYTKVTFTPDFKRLGGSDGIEKDFLALATRRVYDIAACTRSEVIIYLNGEKLPIRTFEKYMNLYLGDNKSDTPRLFIHLPNEDKTNTGTIAGWDVGVALSDDGFKHVSFVNGIATSEGGSHVNYIRDQVVRKLGKLIRDKNTSMTADVKPEYIRENLWLFVNAVVVNPAFSSQTKEQLTTKPENFGFKHSISDEFITNIEKRLKISKRAVGFAELRQPSILKKTDGKKVKKLHGIPKLEDAKEAGGKLSDQCSLFLTEGDSAKTMAMDGLQIIGNKFYGVFPLKGKPLSTRNASDKDLVTNDEYTLFKRIMGLKEEQTYTTATELRYGCIILMTDQDVDGYHIKGLKISNILDRFPCLLSIPGFKIKCFVTPIVKLEPANAKSKLKEQLFFNISDFENFKRFNANTLGGYKKPRYLKGLGTSESSEARAYFADFNRFIKEYKPNDPSLKTVTELFKFAFDSNNVCIAWRKNWLSFYDDNNVYDYSQSIFPLEEYVDKELKHFSIYSNKRSIGHMCDGLKPSQRKILWAMIEMGLWGDTHSKKVLALSGEISSKSSYHHGEKSLMDTMIGMAQTFVDSNNVNYLYPRGQFGTRLKNGMDASDARYIYTYLCDITKHVFNNSDKKVLLYETDDDGQQIEPKYFAPIIASVLVNGCDGIGTGYSTSVPKYHPVDVIDAHIAWINGEISKISLKPWYRGYLGKIEQSTKDKTKYITYGNYERIGDTVIRITEIPVGRSYDSYKEFLEAHLIENAPTTTAQPKKKQTLDDTSTTDTPKPKKRKAPTTDTPNPKKKVLTIDSNKYFVKDYDSSTFPTQCQFDITFANKTVVDELMTNPEQLYKKLRLTSTLSTNNMHLFNIKGTITKYESPEQIITEYSEIRLDLYGKRKDQLLQEMKDKIATLELKHQFIRLVLDGTIDVRGKSKQYVADQIRSHSLCTDITGDSTGLTPQMKSLLDMKLYDITEEEVNKFLEKMRQLETEYQQLVATTPKDMWLLELQYLRIEMLKFMNNNSANADDAKLIARKKGTQVKKVVAKKKK